MGLRSWRTLLSCTCAGGARIGICYMGWMHYYKCIGLSFWRDGQLSGPTPYCCQAEESALRPQIRLSTVVSTPKPHGRLLFSLSTPEDPILDENQAHIKLHRKPPRRR
ncbi:hypothetical protein METBIDRAFT_112918 [Metschnikowia bicuspidata var. bicuspidata NRRL YB-4993]|uniref:Uncharacterized protein n=1 Tax=Metschnikowia bicuspidata var. bicuspidata NRRL YB-4993 TaxID=869754 RepID=A0A1A0HIF6_9ASCO|nr:hypothetical protein METBIDRAFT_112918 [Metschnikowia bicuspidata var. bicuspidata NRRL YB-4993]OBA23781.1 hypothetical protein METBIDRAFT_112918 [Metschnikowia bicuspidata var. bicuspidata NRRL YB-4993]